MRNSTSISMVCGALVLLCCVMLLAAPSTHAQRSVQFTVKPTIGVFSGYSKFVMDLNVQWETGGIGTVKSELEFPLGVTMAGIQVGVASAPHVHDDWAVEISYAKNLGDPGDLMTDSDWRFDPTPGSLNGQFSYTESNVTMDASLLTIEARKALMVRERWIVGLTAEYRYQKFSQDIQDFYGWYIESNGVEYEQAYEGLALTYEVSYKMPAAGLYATYLPRGVVSFSGRLLGAIVRADDVDDHVLRNRLATADGTGPAVIGGLNARVNVGTADRPMRPFIEGDVEFLSLTVKTSGEQYWYGDDLVTPDENDTGQRLHGIPHNFTSRQLQLRLRAGISF